MKTTISLVVSLISSAAAAYTGTVCPDGKMYSQQIAGCYCENDSNQCVNTAVTCGSSRFKDTAKNKDTPADPKSACCSNKAKCSTITGGGGVGCASGDKLKANAADLLCASGACTTADRTTCCEQDSTKCKYSTVTCPTPAVAPKYKDSAKDSTTAGSMGIATCCSNRKRCSTWKCPTLGKKQRCNAGTLFCAGTTCVANDETTCCVDDEQYCRGASVSCNANRFKDSAKYGKVGTTDATCCTNKQACTSANCDAGQAKIAAAATTYCATSACAASDKATCCVDVATKCKGAGVSCNANRILDSAKWGDVGTTDAKCCIDRARCDAAGVNCAAGRKKIAAAATTFCAGTTCTAAETTSLCCENNAATCYGSGVACGVDKYLTTANHGTAQTTVALCCTARHSCTGFGCSHGKKLRANPATLYCATNACVTADDNTCCETDTTKCLSIACGSGKILTTGAQLGVAHDGRIATCCTTRTTCNNRVCPAGYKHIALATTTYCATSACGTADDATCCVTDTAKCLGATVTCNANRFKDPAKSNVVGTTDALCCTNRAKCSGVQCATGRKKITAAATTHCAGGSCTTTEVTNTCCVDNTALCGGNVVSCPVGKYRDAAKYGTTGTTAALCCSNAAKCSSINCVAGTKQKLAHATTYCASATCGTSDQSTCCEIDDTKCKGVTVSCPTCKYKDTGKNGVSAGKFNCCTNKGLCKDLTCGAGLKKKANDATTHCASSSCTTTDYAVCCENIAGKCRAATVTCAAGKFKDPAKYGTTGATAALCCSNKAKCSSVTCATGKKQIAAAATTYCAGSSCATSDNCCENDSTRCQYSGVSCGVGKYKDTSKNGAVGSTAAQCCGTAALCTTLTCPTALKQIAANTTTYCAGATCGGVADVATCCEANPALTACSAAAVGLGALDKLKCGPAAFYSSLSNGNRVIDHNKTVKCCTNKALCSSVTCPAGKKQISAAATTYCAGSTWVTADLETCCETDDTKCLAASVSCATGQFKDPAKNGAVGTTAATCCSNKAKCTSIACPAGQKQVANHASLSCAGLSCGTLAANRAICCINNPTTCLGSCVQCAAGTYKDPAKYATASGQNAQNVCCTGLAACSMTACVSGQRVKSGSLYCATKTCGSSDRSTCCENDPRKCLGATVTCGSKMYKDSTKHGSLIGCDAVASCCSHKARCSTYTCPSGKQLKDNAYDTYCATKTCGTADTTTCCEADVTVCAGATVSCPAGKFKDAAKGAEAVSDVKTKCCTGYSKCHPSKPTVNATGTVAGAPRAAMTSVIALALAAVVMMVAAAH